MKDTSMGMSLCVQCKRRGWGLLQTRKCACKGNCGPKKHLKCHAHLRASKSISRGSKDVQLHNNELEYIIYLAGDPKRKE